MEKLQIVSSNNDGICGWIDEIFEDKIRICFFDCDCDLMSKEYFGENFICTEEFI